MLAARFPTAISRQNLSQLASPRRSPRSPRRAVWEDLWDREVVAYAVVSFCYALGQSLYDIFQSQQAKQMTTQLLKKHAIEDDEGYMAAYAYAILVSAYAFAKAVSSPYVGFLSDRFGRRPILVATLVCTALALLLCGRATTFSGVLACRLFTGCVANGGLLTARATDMATSHMRRTRLFALFTTSWAVARVVAACLMKVMKMDLGGACALACCCELVAAFIAAFSFKEQLTPRHAARKLPEAPKTRPSLRALAREVLSERLAYALFITALCTPRVDAASFVWKRFGAGPEAVGVLKALEAVAVVVVSLTPASQALQFRFGGAGAAVVAAGCVSGGWLGIAAAPTMTVFYILVFLRSCCAALYDPAARSLCFQRATSSSQKSGSLMGIQNSMKGATQVFGSWLGAYLTSLSVALPLFVSAAASVANAFNIAVECAEDVFDSSAAHKKDDDVHTPPDAPVRPDTPPQSPKLLVAEAVSPLPRIPSGKYFLGDAYAEAEAWPLRAFFEVGKGGGTRARLLCTGPTQAPGSLLIRRRFASPATLEGDSPRKPSTPDLSRVSVHAVSNWLQSRGQAFAAQQAKAAGVDGTALQIGEADELHDALGGEVSRLVCRAILRAARSKSGARALLQTVSSSDGDLSPATPRGDAGALAGLTSVGRRRALELRCVDEPPQLVVVAPERAALQTALLAFRQGTPQEPRSRALSSASDSTRTPPPSPRLAFRPVPDEAGASSPLFVAHDAARYAPTSAARELRLEYGAVDFGACDDGFNDAGPDDPRRLARNAYALLCFVRARPETDIAIVADGAVLEALVNATRGGHDRLALDPKAIHEFRLRFEDEGSLQESEEAMEW